MENVTYELTVDKQLWSNVGLMLGQRRRTNIGWTSCVYLIPIKIRTIWYFINIGQVSSWTVHQTG